MASELPKKPLADEWEQAEEALEQLQIKEEPKPQPEEKMAAIANANQMEPASAKEPPAEHPVDHALRDALSRHKHRNSVLRLEAEVEDFVLNSTELQRVFSGEMSSYDRLLVHRTAQYWGLDTSTVKQGPEQGTILAIRTPRTGTPPVKLADLEVTMEEPLIPGQSSNPASAPKVLVRKTHHNNYSHGRPMRHQQSPPRGAYNPNGAPQYYHMAGPQHPYQQPPMPSNYEDREQHYERARARIFGGGDGGGGGQQMMPPPQYMQQQQQQQRAPQQQNNNNKASNYNSSSANSSPNNNNNNTNSNQTNNNNNKTKAQLRNREQDLSDPDFRRGKFNGPRFDPGFNEEMMAASGMYVRPTYSSEFPELAGGGGGGRGGGAGPPQMAYYAHPMMSHPGYASGYAYPTPQGYAYYHPGTATGQPVYAQPSNTPSTATSNGGGNTTGKQQQQSPQQQPQMQQMYPYPYAPAMHAMPGRGPQAAMPMMVYPHPVAGAAAMYSHPGMVGSPPNVPTATGLMTIGSPPNGAPHMMMMAAGMPMQAPPSPHAGHRGGGGNNNNRQQQHRGNSNNGYGGGGNRPQQQQEQNGGK